MKHLPPFSSPINPNLRRSIVKTVRWLWDGRRKREKEKGEYEFSSSFSQVFGPPLTMTAFHSLFLLFWLPTRDRSVIYVTSRGAPSRKVRSMILQRNVFRGPLYKVVALTRMNQAGAVIRGSTRGRGPGWGFELARIHTGESRPRPNSSS